MTLAELTAIVNRESQRQAAITYDPRQMDRPE